MMHNGPLTARKEILIIFLLSIMCQSIFILAYANKLDPIRGDGREYHLLALNLLEKGAFAGYITNDDANIRRPPGYPFFIACIYKIFGKRIAYLQAAQAVLTGITCILIYLIAGKITGNPAAFSAGILAALNPVLVSLSFHVISESLAAFLITLSLYLIVALSRKLNISLCIILGIVFGMTTLTRPTVMFFPFFVLPLFIMLYRGTDIIKYISAILLAFLIIVSSWSARNYFSTGYIIPVSLGGEMELWNGSYLPGRGYSDHPLTNKKREELRIVFREKIGSRKFNQRFNYVIEWKLFQEEALKNIARNPLGYIALFPQKMLRLYIGSFSFQYGIDISFSDLVNNKFANGIIPALSKSMNLLNAVMISSLCIIGIILNYKRNVFYPLTLLFCYWTLLNIIFSPITRYSIPIIPVMILSAISGASHLDKLFKNRKENK